VHSEIGVLFDFVVETGGFPCVGEEDEGYGLSKVVELEAAGAYGVHDGCVVDDSSWDTESSGAEDDISVCRCAGLVLVLVFRFDCMSDVEGGEEMVCEW
jgi:hypothetical protein